jgi:sarcosine oxidase subunit beta
MTDVVVVGGGIVGVSAALFLAESGVDVTVVERSGIAAEASGVNGGIVGRWRLVEPGRASGAETELGTGGIAFYRRLAEECGHDIGLRRSGSLTVVPTEADLAWVQGLELVNAELLDPAAAREIEAALDPGIAGAVWAPDSVSAEPAAAVQAAAAEAEHAGVRFEVGRAVTAISATSGGFRVEVEQTVFDADVVAIAAGPWSGDVARLLDPALDVPVIGVQGQMWATEPVERAFHAAISSVESLRHWATNPATEPPNLTHTGDRRITRHLYGRQRPNGEIVFGGDRQVLDSERRVRDAGIAANFAQAAEILPVLRDLKPVRTWTGIMPWTLDGEPILGPLEGAVGLYVATGLASSGFTRGPMTGQRLAQMIIE